MVKYYLVHVLIIGITFPFVQGCGISTHIEVGKNLIIMEAYYCQNKKFITMDEMCF